MQFFTYFIQFRFNDIIIASYKACHNCAFLLILIAFIVIGRLNAENRSLICNLRTHKSWGSTRMIKEFPNKMWKRRAVD